MKIKKIKIIKKGVQILLSFAFLFLLNPQAIFGQSNSNCNCQYSRREIKDNQTCISNGDQCLFYPSDSLNLSFNIESNICYQNYKYCSNNGMPPEGNCGCTKIRTDESSFKTQAACLGNLSIYSNRCVKPYSEYPLETGWVYHWDGSCKIDIYSCPSKIAQNPEVKEIGPDFVRIEWQTEISTTTFLAYSDGYTGFSSDDPLTWGETRIDIDSNKVTTHSVRISNLQPSSTYYYRVTGIDTKNKYSEFSTINNFTTTSQSISPTPTTNPNCGCQPSRKIPVDQTVCQTNQSSSCFGPDGRDQGYLSYKIENGQCYEMQYFCNSGGRRPEGNCSCQINNTESRFSAYQENCVGPGGVNENRCVLPSSDYPLESGWLISYQGGQCTIGTYECKPQIILNSLSVTEKEQNYAKIEWKTDVKATTYIAYSDEPGGFDSNEPINWGKWRLSKDFAGFSSMTKDHSIRIEPLLQNKTYYYRVSGKGYPQTGLFVKFSDINSFTLQEPTSTPPLGNPSPSVSPKITQTQESFTLPTPTSIIPTTVRITPSPVPTNNPTGTNYTPTPTSRPGNSVTPSPSPTQSCGQTVDGPCCRQNAPCNTQNNLYCVEESSVRTCKRIQDQNPNIETWNNALFTSSCPLCNVRLLDFNNDGTINETDYLLWLKAGKSL